MCKFFKYFFICVVVDYSPPRIHRKGTGLIRKYRCQVLRYTCVTDDRSSRKFSKHGYHEQR